MESTTAPVRSELIEELARSITTPNELFGPEGLLQRLKVALMERLLEAEMTAHLGFSPNQQGLGTNRRNGHTQKTIQTDSGPLTIRVPRDRHGTFEPQTIAKHQRRLEGFDEKVLALYAQGSSVRDIQQHLQEIYGTDVSADLISRVTDSALEQARAWQERPLERLYPILYLDALYVSIRDAGTVSKKAIYVALGVTLEGRREVLGLWVGQNEGARFWLNVLTELRNRGVEDLLFVCCDGLTGFPQAVETAFPATIVQTCIVHMIRASLRYVTQGDRQEVISDLRSIYGADTEQSALGARDRLAKRWQTLYPAMVALWQTRWPELAPFLAYPKEIRKILYTTNAIESLNYQLRRHLRPRGHFPTDDAAIKVLYLAIQRAKLRWKPSPAWPKARAHFAILFSDRLPL